MALHGGGPKTVVAGDAHCKPRAGAEFRTDIYEKRSGGARAKRNDRTAKEHSMDTGRQCGRAGILREWNVRSSATRKKLNDDSARQARQ